MAYSMRHSALFPYLIAQWSHGCWGNDGGFCMGSFTWASTLQTPVIVVTVECPAQDNNLKPLLVLYFLPEPMTSSIAYYILQMLMIGR